MQGCTPPVAKATPTSVPAARVSSTPQTAGTAKPTATLVGPRPSATLRPLQPTTKACSALQCLPIALKQAQAWQADAVLTTVIGGNTAVDGSRLVCDGKAETWSYKFVSISAGKDLTVFIEQGAFKTQMESEITDYAGKPFPKADLEKMYAGLLPLSAWKVDSTQAVETTNELFRAKYNVEPRMIGMILWNTKWADLLSGNVTPWVRWVISYDPERYPFQATVDAGSGEVKERP
ncbi:MAG: hypothetical protein K6V36_05675 [Anaerolineae bacterium]|nr:hypothetical protein [Anaerolineae bacterium]